MGVGSSEKGSSRLNELSTELKKCNAKSLYLRSLFQNQQRIFSQANTFFCCADKWLETPAAGLYMRSQTATQTQKNFLPDLLPRTLPLITDSLPPAPTTLKPSYQERSRQFPEKLLPVQRHVESRKRSHQRAVEKRQEMVARQVQQGLPLPVCKISQLGLVRVMDQLHQGLCRTLSCTRVHLRWYCVWTTESFSAGGFTFV